MTPILRFAVVAALALVVGAGVIGLRPATNVGSPGPSPSATPSPGPLHDGPLSAGTYVTTPFAAPGSDACFVPPQPSCIDGVDDDTIQVTFTVPDGWSGFGSDGVGITSDAAGRAALIFVRGASLAADPCHNDGTDVIPVGPSVNNFESALRNHDGLHVTDAVGIGLGGRTGKYLELLVPHDPTIQGQPGVDGPGCPVYRPWNPWYLAQGPGELWHLWIIDVDGVRVVVQAIDDANTSADARSQLQAIAESVRIERPTDPGGSQSPASLSWSPASLEQDWPGPLRVEPAGDPVIVNRNHTDPVGDVGPSGPSWIDIATVTKSADDVTIGLAGRIASPVPDPGDRWVAYGLVVDEDADGVADTRLGIDNLPAGAGHRAWRTDLHTGRTDRAVGPPYGLVGNGYLDTFFAGDGGPSFSSGRALPRFYAWASLLENGAVVATDYAPDAGWLVTPP